MKALVTGGGGFLGRAIVLRLLARGAQVRSLTRGDHADLRARGVETIQGDIGDADTVRAALRGCDVVFHVAARAGVWGSYSSFYRPNVVGTRNVIDACRAEGVGRLIYTSSPSVVFDGTDFEGGNESAPYPRFYLAHYPKTKAEAERDVIAASGDDLATVALRPHLIWGPGDNHLTPRIVERAQKGQLRRIGNSNKLVDSVYIDNAADAHLQAADRLAPGSAVAGKIYFISNGEPWPVWDLIDAIARAGGAPPVTRRISRRLAMTVAFTMETLYAFLHLPIEPRLTRFVVEELTAAHYFDLSAARRDLGYAPAISITEGLKRLHSWYQSGQPRA